MAEINGCQEMKRLLSKSEWQFSYSSVTWIKCLPFWSRLPEGKEGMAKMDEINQTNIYFLRYSINILEWVCQNLSSSIIMWDIIKTFCELTEVEKRDTLQKHLCQKWRDLWSSASCLLLFFCLILSRLCLKFAHCSFLLFRARWRKLGRHDASYLTFNNRVNVWLTETPISTVKLLYMLKRERRDRET